VGGSCSLLEVQGRRLLVDCGLRMGEGAKEDRLPDLARIQELGGIEAILITHAHADHIGALPLVHLAYPKAPLYTSEATYELMKLMLADSLKIMEQRWAQEEELPLYPEHAVFSMLARVETVELDQTYELLDGAMQMCFQLSGHVLGACSITLHTREGRVFFTGDYSLDLQRTIDGLQLPQERPDLVISESTYGNRLHANRKREEERLVQSVADVIAEGGKVLIPAFALGRAQEVLLILLQAQERGNIPKFPLYVDGMVRKICQNYALHPQFLGKRLRQRVQAQGNPFFYEDSSCQAVAFNQRDSIVSGPPCCIVSSSGMLLGGPSPFYAAELAKSPNNAIFITGYQDEESPGARLLALADGQTRRLRLGSETVEVACQVARYQLSAHADAGQMTSLLSQLNPSICCLVHGDSSARQELSRMLPNSIDVQLPLNGDALEVRFGSALRHSISATAQPRRRDPEMLSKGRGPLTPLAHAQKLLRPYPEVRSVGWRPEAQELVIGVPFPKVFEEQRAQVLAQLRSLYALEVVAKDQLRSLQELARQLLPLGARLNKAPSVYVDRIVLKIRFPPLCEGPEKARFLEQIRAQSGLPLEMEEAEETPLAQPTHQSEGRMEVNQAFRHIVERLAQVGLVVLRTSLKPAPHQLIEVGLLAPWFLDPHQPLWQQLEQETGWTLRAARPNWAALEKQLRQLLPSDWTLLRPPGFHEESRTVRIRLAHRATPEQCQAVSQSVFQELGLHLEIKPS
jgi:Cft2 family RNA processing exonuclease